jgi:head-tail adaptor
MIQLFIEEIPILKRITTPDDSGGELISYKESISKWRARVTPIKGGYAQDQAGMQSTDSIRIVGEVRDDIRVRDRLVYQDSIWEISSVTKINGVGTIPDYLRIDASMVENVEEES